jgi:spore coat polysaccharide biosynthesis protein SpsF (cytidylyltransferase family)
VHFDADRTESGFKASNPRVVERFELDAAGSGFGDDRAQAGDDPCLGKEHFREELELPDLGDDHTVNHKEAIASRAPLGEEADSLRIDRVACSRRQEVVEQNSLRQAVSLFPRDRENEIPAGPQGARLEAGGGRAHTNDVFPFGRAVAVHDPIPTIGPVGGVLAIVQARMSSTRLPGKSLADVGGEPTLSLLLQRLNRARTVSRIVVATSVEAIDDPIADVARDLSFVTYRGSRDDVLARFVGAAAGHSGPVARVTGDCPLIDPEIVDEVVALYTSRPDCVYASNVEPRTYPDGLDIEVVSHDTLERLAAEIADADDREHVTTAIRRSPAAFPSLSLTSGQDLGDLRWTVDTADDLAFVREVVTRLGPRRYEAGMREILATIREEPSLANFRGRRG